MNCHHVANITVPKAFMRAESTLRNSYYRRERLIEVESLTAVSAIDGVCTSP